MRPSRPLPRVFHVAWALAPAAVPALVGAQTLSNPDISVIGDIRLVVRNDGFAKATGARQVQFEFAEAEFNFAGYLNPYMRADATLAAHGFEGPFEIEEVAMTVLRGLPLSLQLKVGKYFLDFGKINTQHPHQWPWLERPLMMRTMLGEEGLLPLGAQLTTLQALGESAVTLSLNAFRGDDFAHGHEEEGHAGAEGPPETMFSGRLAWSQSFGATTMEAGLSGLGGRYDPAEKLDTALAGFDFKLRWRPDTYRAVDLVAESMWSERDVVQAGDSTAAVGPTTVQAAGAFAAARVQFRKQWDTGAYFDFTEDAALEGMKTSAGGVWLAVLPVEETARINLVYRYETSDLYTYDSHGVSLQFLFGLGPHRPHRF